MIPYTIGQVSQHIDVPVSTLRYWESFLDLKIPRNEHNDRRAYDMEHVQLFMRIKHLKYTKHYTMKGVQAELDA